MYGNLYVCCNPYCGFVKIVSFTISTYKLKYISPFEKNLVKKAEIHNFAIEETLIAEKITMIML